MARAPFVFFRRGKVLYAQLWLPEEGRYGTAHSTRTSNRNQATSEVLAWFRDGIPVKRARSRSTLPAAGEWLETFWTEKSHYIQGKKARGDSISVLYVKNNCSFIRRLFTPRFLTQRLNRITTADLEAWVLELFEEGVSPRTVNCALQAVSVGFREATRLGILKTNPAGGVRPVKETPKERGILSIEEAQRLFQVPWTDARAKIASFLAAATGMRLGEVQGLLIEDLELEESGEGLIHVRHNWQDTEGGLVPPKAGSTGTIPVPATIGAELKAIIAANPFHGPFVFYGTEQSRPVSRHIIWNGLYDALNQIGINESTRKERNIGFHSWRAFANSNLRRRVSDANLRKVTRHKAPSMTDRYDRLLAEDLVAVRVAQGEISESIWRSAQLFTLA